jgi:hypothetical protein
VCTVQFVHFGGEAGGGSSLGEEELWWGLRKSEEVSSLSSPGYGTYSCGIVERSAMVFASEYVPRNARMTRGFAGSCESAM